ncbi:MAG: hypothetical protein JO139_15520 [Alphaproteobacteria bacterium]|nr:hypothetical protein [Alphaproteobacteria bacterium]
MIVTYSNRSNRKARPADSGDAPMPRYEQLEEAKLTPEQRRIWDECKAGPRGSVPPPVHVWLKSPGLADHAHKLGAYVRFGPRYTPKQTEIAILCSLFLFI